MFKPIVWTIAGSDCGGGAGIQADLHTFHALGTHGCSVIAALTAQNSQKVRKIEFVSADMLTAQIEALTEDMPACAIKLGMLGSLPSLQAITLLLKKLHVPIIYDPVLFASAGASLHEGDVRQFLREELFPILQLLTPNIPEAEWLLGRELKSNADIENAAQELLALGPKAILIKGGHAKEQQNYCQDFWTDGKHSGWLTNKRLTTNHRHGSGCTLASAITACLAHGHELSDAIIIAKAYVNQGMRFSAPLGKGPGPIEHLSWPMTQEDYPWLSPTSHVNEFHFPTCGPEPLGFYPIVETVEWVEKLVSNGVTTLQLRIKTQSQTFLENEIKKSIDLARKYNARLFINDHWELAIKFGAYGVHLGQEDLEKADFAAIQKAGLRLGISTHSYTEIARAHAIRPSYLAMGPIYPTQTKAMPFAPQGLEKLLRYRRTFDYPFVAIGGINWQRMPGVWQTGVNGVAVISAITTAKNPEAEIKRWVNFFKGAIVINQLNEVMELP